MKYPTRSKVIAFSAALGLASGMPAIAGPGHGGGHSHGAADFSAGSPGDPKKPARIIPVTMNETEDGKMIYVPSKFVMKKGEQVRFVISNAGKVAHEFVLASTEENLKHGEMMKKFPEMEHDDPNNKTVQPKGKAEILWRFDKSGTFEIGCLIPGHRESGMLASVEVK